MKALIVYTSWLSSTRVVAKLLAAKLAQPDLLVRYAPAARIAPDDLADYDLLVLGADVRMSHANKRLRSLCTALPRHRLGRLEVALFGVRPAEWPPRHRHSAFGELQACLADRGCELALPALELELQPVKALLPWVGLGKPERAKVAEFAVDLWAASMPEPMI